MTEGEFITFGGPLNNGDFEIQSSQRGYGGVAGAMAGNIENSTKNILNVLDSSFGIAKSLNSD